MIKLLENDTSSFAEVVFIYFEIYSGIKMKKQKTNIKFKVALKFSIIVTLKGRGLRNKLKQIVGCISRAIFK